jgi:hypothetical protein
VANPTRPELPSWHAVRSLSASFAFCLTAVPVQGALRFRATSPYCAPACGRRPGDLARRARRAGKTVPASDILICACARQHGVAIEHGFDLLAAL